MWRRNGSRPEIARLAAGWPLAQQLLQGRPLPACCHLYGKHAKIPVALCATVAEMSRSICPNQAAIQVLPRRPHLFRWHEQKKSSFPGHLFFELFCVAPLWSVQNQV